MALRIPTDVEREQLMHEYNAEYARQYYLRTRRLKGRKKGQGEQAPSGWKSGSKDPRRGKTRQQIKKDARARQRKELAQAIQGMEQRLNKLEALIKKRAQEEKSEDRKGKAKKERAAKESQKPKTAAEKAKAARESEKYRDKNQQKLKTAAKKRDAKSKGGSSTKSKGSDKNKHSVSELKSLATKVRGQIAVAKQKLAAL
jgi:hypothetical protein